MKKVIKKTFFKIPLVFLCICGTQSACAKESFVAVSHDLSTKTGNVGFPTLMTGSYDVTQERQSNKYIVTYKIKSLSKKECVNLINDKISYLADASKAYPETDNRHRLSQYSIYDKAYTYDAIVEYFNVYYCIPFDMWNQMQVYKKENLAKNLFEYIGDEILYKEAKSFYSVMKKCGLSKFDFNHINLPETPFICDEYNENNPVPYKSYDELMNSTQIQNIHKKK